MKSDIEVRINREVGDYTEEMFFGLSLRQFIFSVLACGLAVTVYFLLKPLLGLETVSWVCIIAAAPFAALGFFKYNGMTAEKFMIAWFRSTFLMPEHLAFGNTSFYWNLQQETEVEKKKNRKKRDAGRRRHAKNT